MVYYSLFYCPKQDLLAQSLSGYASIVGHDGPPQTGGVYVVDMYSSMLLTCGILTAIIAKKNGQKAQKVEVNLLDAGIHLQSQELGYYLNTGKKPVRPKRYSGHIWQESPYGIYKTKNGYISLSTNASEKPDVLGKILDITGLAEKMSDKVTMLKDRDKLYDILAPAMEKQTTEDLLRQFREAGFWCARVNDYEDVVQDPQVIYNKIIQEIDHPKAGKIKVVAAPIQFSGTPAVIRRPPPLLGQHNEEILGELGYAKEQIEDMKKAGVF
jgi:crotonobetainyl-CoA:carnitine CoA-transferase CaiB-like acyl-CoA transferase